MCNNRLWLEMSHKERQEIIGSISIAIQRDVECMKKVQDVIMLAKSKKVFKKCKVNVVNNTNIF